MVEEEKAVEADIAETVIADLVAKAEAAVVIVETVIAEAATEAVLVVKAKAAVADIADVMVEVQLVHVMAEAEKVVDIKRKNILIVHPLHVLIVLIVAMPQLILPHPKDHPEKINSKSGN